MKNRLIGISPVRLLVLILLSSCWQAAAYYDPGVQRWLNRDPLGEPGFQVVPKLPASAAQAGANGFVFVRNCPIRWFDALGLKLGDGKVHGNYCGGGYCGGKRLKPDEQCDYSAPAADDMDSCCKDHDKCYDDAKGDACKTKKCDQDMCGCLKDKVDQSNFSKPDDEIAYNKLLTWACNVQGGDQKKPK